MTRTAKKQVEIIQRHLENANSAINDFALNYSMYKEERDMLKDIKGKLSNIYLDINRHSLYPRLGGTEMDPKS